MPRGTVISYPEAGRNAVGKIQSDGTFKFETNGYGPGAVVGTHRLTVVAYEENPEAETNPEAELKPLVPLRYTQPHTSGLSVEVMAGRETIANLELKK